MRTALPLLFAGLLAATVALPAQTFNGRSASEWVKDLGAEDVAVRDVAVRAIESMGERAMRATMTALDDERPVVRQHAARALGQLGAVAASAKDKLIALRQDKEPDVAKAATVAAMRVQVAADDTLKDGDRQQLLAVGLRTLVKLDAAAHRALFEKHAKSVEREVRNAALRGLARLGDAEAHAEIRKLSAMEVRALELPDDLRQLLEGARLRMSQVDGCTLRDVIARLRKQLGMPIDVAADVDAKLLDARFGNYIGLLGYRPSALDVLFAIRFAMLVGGRFGPNESLEPIFHQGRIELVPGENQLPRGKR